MCVWVSDRLMIVRDDLEDQLDLFILDRAGRSQIGPWDYENLKKVL